MRQGAAVHHPPLGIPAAAPATYQMVLAAAGLAVITDLTGITAITQDPGALLEVVVGLGVLGTGLAFVFSYLAVNGLGALTASTATYSTATYIAPVVALVIGVGLLGEPLQPVTLGAVVLILGAAVLTQLPSPRTGRATRLRHTAAQPPGPAGLNAREDPDTSVHRTPGDRTPLRRTTAHHQLVRSLRAGSGMMG